MQILDNGPSGFYYEFKCKGCKAKLAADEDDVQVGYFGANYGGDSPSREYYAECPRCGTEHKIPFSKIPLLVRQKADDKENKGDWR